MHVDLCNNKAAAAEVTVVTLTFSTVMMNNVTVRSHQHPDLCHVEPSGWAEGHEAVLLVCVMHSYNTCHLKHFRPHLTIHS